MRHSRLDILGHLGIRLGVAVGQEHGIPAKIGRATSRDDLTRHATVKCEGFLARPGAEGEDGLRVC